MPHFSGRVVAIENNGAPIWQTPDGQRKIWKLTVESNGQPVPVKTYSEQIARLGYQGELEAYEKPGRDGSETFIKQYQDPNAQNTAGYQQGYQSQSQPATTNSPATTARTGGYQPKDEAAIRAMWAIGQAVQLGGVVGNSQPPIDWVEETAVSLFHMVDRVKTSPEPEPETMDTPFGTATEPDPAELNGLFPNQSYDDGAAPAWQGPRE
jgi:hypothetical protein